MPQPKYPVHDDLGREIDPIQRVWLGRIESEVWHAMSLDGCDLRSHEQRRRCPRDARGGVE